MTRQAAIVTGAGRGFGAAIAKALARAGAADGGVVCVAEADVTDRFQVFHAVGAAEAGIGPITLLVSNAGVAGPFGPIGIVDPDEWWQALAVHLRGPLLLLSAALPGMRERRAGRIIVVASLAGRLVTPHLSAYGMGKASQIRLIQQIHAENPDYGLSACAIEPGTAITELADGTIASPEAQRWLPGTVERLKRMKRTAGPAPVLARRSQMCVALASGRYDALSGQYLEPGDDLDVLLRAA